MADANFGSKGLPVGIILLVAGFCHAFLFGLNIVALMRKPKAGYMV
jgi:hypothetical protein